MRFFFFFVLFLCETYKTWCSGNISLPLNLTTIVVQQYIPMDICDPETKGFNNFKGIEVEILIDTMIKLGKKYGEDWQFICVKSTVELTELLMNEEKVIGAISGFSITSYFPLQYNFTFSQSYFDNHLAFISKSTFFYTRSCLAGFTKVKDYNFMLVILRMFSWEFLLCFVLINLVCACAVYFWEGRRIPFYELFFHYSMHFFGLNSLRLEKLETRILDVTHLIVSVIFFSVVVSFLIENTSISAKTNGVSSPEDLKRKNVVTFPEYKDVLEGIGIKTELNPDIDLSNIEGILDSSNRSAVLVDEVVGLIAEHVKCTLFLSTRIENPVSIGMLINPRNLPANQLKLQDINEAILKVGEVTNFRDRTRDFFDKNFKDKECEKPPIQMNKDQPLKWDELWYMWIPLGVIILLGFLDHSIIQFRKIYNAMKANNSFSFSKIMIMNSKLQKQLSTGLKKLSVFDKHKQLKLKQRYLTLAGREKFDSQLTYNIGKTINSLVYDMKVSVSDEFFEKFSTLLIRPERRAQLYAQKKRTNQTFNNLTLGGPLLKSGFTKAELEKGTTFANLFDDKLFSQNYDLPSTERNFINTLPTERKANNNGPLLSDRPGYSTENRENEDSEKFSNLPSDLSERATNELTLNQFHFHLGDSPFVSPRSE